jgi:predicted nucleic acid-binding protein
MPAKPFLDTNVLVYAFTTDVLKKTVARDLIFAGGQISVQVLNEFVNVSRRKLRREWTAIRAALQLLYERLDHPSPLTIETHRWAVDLAGRHQLGMYDSLILASARQAGCRVLYSEDLQHGQTVDGVEIRNPFLAA